MDHLPSTLPGNLQGPLTELPPAATPAEAQTALEPSRRRGHVVLTPAPTPVPQTYEFGFAASTGLFTDVHLIRNVVIDSEQPRPRSRRTATTTNAPSLRSTARRSRRKESVARAG
ncbi:hypothetical protein [Saccharopolyspora sp. NPDC002376]